MSVPIDECSTLGSTRKPLGSLISLGLGQPVHILYTFLSQLQHYLQKLCSLDTPVAT